MLLWIIERRMLCVWYGWIVISVDAIFHIIFIQFKVECCIFFPHAHSLINPLYAYFYLSAYVYHFYYHIYTRPLCCFSCNRCILRSIYANNEKSVFLLERKKARTHFAQHIIQWLILFLFPWKITMFNSEIVECYSSNTILFSLLFAFCILNEREKE